jgi:biotin transport system ATP-binding protein
LLNGLIIPTTGHVTVLGQDTAKDGAAVRRRVGFVFQNPDSQLVMPTVVEDLTFGLKAHGVPAAIQATRIDAVLAQLEAADLRDRACAELSGGEKQLVALAGALVLEPAILVCDEPTAMLDRRHARLFMEVLARLPQQVIVITHHIELLTSFDRVLVFEAGRVVADGPATPTVAGYAAHRP